ncbi:hypothetical protein K474DRAFT_1697183 [Panus rudis PR-1116 ss-1]|nr:hypothetical protein K474DRAFT_1697183 [Panus rudis PR-1116 ss-1]
MPSRRTAFDLSIVGDEQEQHRIQLEQNLQHTDLSLHLSSEPDHSEIEYPRHYSDPASFSAGFASFDHHSRDEPSHYQPWSLRTDDDEEGISPYAGATMSTAAHHASALTISAGLGGRGTRRDTSVSGAEYDPDRPVRGVVAGMASRRYVDQDRTGSKQITHSVIDFDPLVVDDTEELDRILQPRTDIRAALSRSPQSSISSGTTSDASPVSSPRPKLSDALQHAVFSPKRPRSAQSTRSTRTHRSETRPESPLARPHSSGAVRNKSQQSLSYAAIPSPRKRNTDEPVVNVRPPTPEQVSEHSTFPRLAKGITKEIEAARKTQRGAHARDGQPYAHSTVRQRGHAPAEHTAKDISVNLGSTPKPSKYTPNKHQFKSKLHLPDITGLTSVVESPARLSLRYLGLDGIADGEHDARIAATLSAVQAKLAYLEAENSISRRRVRELEAELEECKKDVLKERTKILEQDAINHPPVNTGHSTHEANQSRYKEVVEEKKALEALISTLRSHLSRLTSELSSHHQLLEDLRALQNRDSRTFREKCREVEKLRQEVERLSGEVEVLRGVVEEGLKERREIREHEPQEPSARRRTALDTHSDESEVESQDQSEDDQPDISRASSRSSVRSSQAPPAQSRPQSPPPPPAERIPDREEESYAPFISEREISRISQEVEGRRSERSLSSSSSSRSEHSRTSFSRSKDSSASFVSNASPVRASSPRAVPIDQPPPPTEPALKPSSTGGEAPPKPSRATASKVHRAVHTEDDEEVPVPNIRGTHLERLFYAAPVHNERSCAVCHRPRTRDRKPNGTDTVPEWLRNRTSKDHAPTGSSSDDEGFVEGSERRDQDHQAEDDRIPPQTVLVKVLKELEDDFTHYKFIYSELADQYKTIDAASNVAKRNVIAEHLRDVIDELERKGDQIASLYDLLSFRDKSIP